MRVDNAEQLASVVGLLLGPTEWRPVSQREVDAFAELTGDNQWIHTDPQRAANGPFGGTVAHGYLILSLLPTVMRALVEVPTDVARINYGLNRVRFPAPTFVGSSIRGTAEVMNVSANEAGADVEFEVIVEATNSRKPVCVARTMTRFAFATSR